MLTQKGLNECQKECIFAILGCSKAHFCRKIFILLIFFNSMRLISIEEVEETLEAWKKKKEGKKREKEEYQQKE